MAMAALESDVDKRLRQLKTTSAFPERLAADEMSALVVGTDG
jgi:hypothetical protein